MSRAYTYQLAFYWSRKPPTPPNRTPIEQQKATKGNKRQQKATKGNKRQQKATKGNKRQ